MTPWMVQGFSMAGSLPKAVAYCGVAGHKANWRAGSSVAVSLPSLGWNGLSFRGGAAVKAEVHGWQTVAERSGVFFYAAIDGDFIQTTNTDLIAATRLGALVLAVDSADGSLRKQWILDKKVNRNGKLCLSDEAG
jgi:hypothetical protein